MCEAPPQALAIDPGATSASATEGDGDAAETEDASSSKSDFLPSVGLDLNINDLTMTRRAAS